MDADKRQNDVRGGCRIGAMADCWEGRKADQQQSASRTLTGAASRATNDFPKSAP